MPADDHALSDSLVDRACSRRGDPGRQTLRHVLFLFREHSRNYLEVGAL
jgi:hypothetical protein